MAKRISKDQAKILFEAFKNTKSKELNKIVKKLSNDKKKEDAFSSWFSIKDLEDYVNYLKDNNANGARIYLGAYSKEEEPREKDEYYTTVFMVPTKMDSSASSTSDKSNSENLAQASHDDPNLEALNGGTIGEPPFDPPYGGE